MQGRPPATVRMVDASTSGHQQRHHLLLPVGGRHLQRQGEAHGLTWIAVISLSLAALMPTSPESRMAATVSTSPSWAATSRLCRVRGILQGPRVDQEAKDIVIREQRIRMAWPE